MTQVFADTRSSYQLNNRGEFVLRIEGLSCLYHPVHRKDEDLVTQDMFAYGYDIPARRRSRRFSALKGKGIHRKRWRSTSW